jgi:hypothetical protein
MNKLLEAALQYEAKGFSVIPAAKDKKPLTKWELYQSRRATSDEIKSWWSKMPDANIGLVTGEISNLLVVDADTVAGITRINDAIPDGLLVPCERTPRGGKHFFFSHQDGFVNKAKVAEGIDVRTKGGFIIVAPSVNGTGRSWQWMEGLSLFEVQAPSIPNAIEIIIKALDFKGGVLGGVQNQKETQLTTTTTTDHNFFSYGKRDDSLFHTANLMTKAGGEPAFICEVLERLILSWGENPDKRWIDAKIKSALDRVERKERNISSEVHDFVMTTTGHFLTTDVHIGLQVTTRNDKKAVVMALKRLCDQRVIQKYGDKNGMFIKIETDIELINWENADDSILPLQFPFEIERLVSIMPKNILVIAGIPNAGKTAFLLNFARMNMDKWPILYFSSEMDGPELKARLKKFEGPLKQWRKVGFYKKEEDFANALNPDGVNIIDFLEITDKFYLIAERLREYHKRLNKGVLFVAIQKDPQKEYGRGGGLGLEKPRLYLTMDRGRLKIIKGKTWASEQNPEGMQMELKIVQGAKFIAQGEWKAPEKKEHQDRRYGSD